MTAVAPNRARVDIPSTPSSLGKVRTWWRTFGRPPRILGLDIARALAILGMIGAHVGSVTDLDVKNPATYLALVHGRPSLLFAVLAGISIALLTKRLDLATGAEVLQIRLRMVGRGAAIFLIGVALEASGTELAIILSLYGALYILVIPFLRWTARRLLIAGSLLVVFGPMLLSVLRLAGELSGPGVNLVLAGTYPITVWLALCFIGMAIGKLNPGSRRTAKRMVIIGLPMTAIAYWIGATFVDSIPTGENANGAAIEILTGLLAWTPHSGGTAEVAGSLGIALMIIGGCVLASGRLRAVMLPLAALGSMPLTAYSAHVLIILLAADDAGIVIANWLWVWMCVGLTIAATLWAIYFGQGPLERLTGKAARAMSTPHAVKEDADSIHTGDLDGGMNDGGKPAI